MRQGQRRAGARRRPRSPPGTRARTTRTPGTVRNAPGRPDAAATRPPDRALRREPARRRSAMACRLAGEPSRRLGLGGARWPSLRADRPLVARPGRLASSSTGRTCRSRPTRSSPRGRPEAARVLAAAGAQVLVAPAAAYGASGEHEGFPGTISIGHEALHAAARRARPLGLPMGGAAWSSSTATAATCRPSRRPSTCCATRAGRWRGPRATCPVPTPTPGAPRRPCCCNLAPGRCGVDLIEAGATDPGHRADAAAARRGRRRGRPNGVLGDPPAARRGGRPAVRRARRPPGRAS